MSSMFGPSPTPTKYTYNYSGGGSPYYGDKTAALYGLGGLPQRTSVLKILKESYNEIPYTYGTQIVLFV